VPYTKLLTNCSGVLRKWDVIGNCGRRCLELPYSGTSDRWVILYKRVRVRTGYSDPTVGANGMFISVSMRSLYSASE